METGDGSRVVVASGDALDVRQFTVHERMSSLFEVSLVAHCANPSIDFDEVVGHAAQFEVRAGPHERRWSGLCNQLQLVAVEEGGLSTYHLCIVPSLWLATQRRNYRMFQQQSELEIVLSMLGEWGVDSVKKLTAVHKKREYRVQYGESDFAFISRMLEESGILFHFEQCGDESRLVLTDAPEANEPRQGTIPFLDNPTPASVEHVTAVRIGRQVRTGRATLRDHDYRLPPEYKLLASAEVEAGVEQRLEDFEYVPGAFLFRTERGEGTPVADDRGKVRTDEAEARILAQNRLAARRADALVCTFATTALDLAPGTVLRMMEHPHADLGEDRKWLVVESTMSGAPGHLSYHCEARSASTPFRPELRTAKPNVAGVESATVVGPTGEEIHADEFGRVRVHFHWDRESRLDEKSSCWIHVSQPWAGAGYGGVNLPRVGQEVLVDFLGGDPDRPVIVGRVYTGLQKPPYKLPDHRTQSGWKSRSTGETGGYNEIMFEDARGNELLRMQAERDLQKLVKNNESSAIGGNRSETIGGNDSSTAGNNRSRMVGGSESVTIGSNQAVTVGSHQTITVGAGQTETITGDRSLTLTGKLTETITGSSTLTQIGHQTETLVGDRDLTQMGSRSETVKGDLSLVQVGSQTEVQAGGRTLLQAGSETALRVGNELHAQIGSELDIRVGGSTRLHVGGQKEIVTGHKAVDATSVGVDASTIATIKAALLELIGSGAVEIKGGVVNVTGGTVNVDGGALVNMKAVVIKLN